MKRSSLLVPACLAVVGLAAAAGTFAQPVKDSKATPAATAQPEHQLPPGWTEADMKACIEAGTPGPMHEVLAAGVGEWSGKSSMWMAPGGEPMKSDCTLTMTAMMDGRFVKSEMSGEIPDMGPFNGFGVSGFDNVSQKFQSAWIDSMGTGMMTGTGTLSSDGKTLTWTYNYNCPVTKKPAVMREIERITGKDTKTFEMHGTDPKSGKEFKMMEIVLTRKPGSGKAAAGATIIPISGCAVEVACGSCVFGMKNVDGCKLAVKIDGKSYLMNGSKLDAHDFCDHAKKAVVSGNIEGDRFLATAVELKPDVC